MTVWFVSRHQGAIDWVKESDIQVDRFVAHLNVAEVEHGDTVIGTLPVHLAAEICAKGAKFAFLELPQTLEGRGSEYTAQDMREMGARLQRFDVKKCE